jgi:hypothetical protein
MVAASSDGTPCRRIEQRAGGELSTLAGGMRLESEAERDGAAARVRDGGLI